MKQTKRVGIPVAALLTILFLCAAALSMHSTAQNNAWLPDVQAQRTENEAAYNLPKKRGSALTEYGRSNKYTADDDFTTIYSFRSSARLEPSACPKIIKVEELMPSACKSIGLFHGSPIYVIHRSLPSGRTEYYFDSGGIFTYVDQHGDGGENIQFIQSFVLIKSNDLASYMQESAGRVEKIVKDRKSKQTAADSASSIAYSKLNFIPALPHILPFGWLINTTVAGKGMSVDGPDEQHPELLNVEYTNTTGLFMTLHEGLLSNYKLTAGSCGPTPGLGMTKTTCAPVQGTNDFETISFDTNHYYTRTVYHPFDNLLVITTIQVFPDDSRRDRRDEQVAAQNKFMDSITRIPLSSLKGSVYNKTVY